MILRAVLMAGLTCSAVAAAQPDPMTAAIQHLETAKEALRLADRADDPVQALVKSIRSYEAGLAAVPNGMNDLATRETQLHEKLQRSEAETAEFLGVLQSLRYAPPPETLLHPAGPLGAARSGMMLASVRPALETRSAQVGLDLAELRALRDAQQIGAQELRNGQRSAEEARLALAEAMARRVAPPKRFTEDPVRTAILISSTDTLDAFIDGLPQLSATPIIVSEGDIGDRKGALALPVQGAAQNLDEPRDASDNRRDGLAFQTRARALVTSPFDATIRYRGPLLDMGNVVILEPQDGMLLILSGLADVFGNIGDVVQTGTPLGFMGGKMTEIGTILSLRSDGTGADLSETLYIAITEGGRPVDPETWFRTDKDG